MFSFPLHVRYITCQMYAKTRQGLIISALRCFAKIGSVQLFDSGVKNVYTLKPPRHSHYGPSASPKGHYHFVNWA